MNLSDNSSHSPEQAETQAQSAPQKSQRRPRMALTRDLRRPTEYVRMLNGEFSEWAFNEERAPLFKGKWREQAFKTSETHPLDLEIGTGNGYHFAHLAAKKPGHALVGIEIKFKPLIQSIRRALRAGSTNARIVRYDASLLDDLFAAGELNDVYIHHPDPWPKERHWKHRLIQKDFLESLFALQRLGAFVDFKTDSEDYYDWSLALFKDSPYEVVRETRDLHRSEWKDENFVTHFESIFLSKGQPIFYARLLKK